MISTLTIAYSSCRHASFVIKNLDERVGIDSNCNVILLGCTLVLNAQSLKKGVMIMYVFGKRRLGKLLLMLLHHRGDLE
jgi:hypothetical protein